MNLYYPDIWRLTHNTDVIYTLREIYLENMSSAVHISIIYNRTYEPMLSW